MEAFWKSNTLRTDLEPQLVKCLSSMATCECVCVFVSHKGFADSQEQTAGAADSLPRHSMCAQWRPHGQCPSVVEYTSIKITVISRLL